MSSDYNKLEDDFNKKIRLMQNKCPHKESGWIQEHWAIGHPTGSKVCVCLNCNKILERKEPKPYGSIGDIKIDEVGI